MKNDDSYGQRGSGPRLGAIETDSIGRTLCRWCRKPVAPPRKTWCSQFCVDEYLSRAQWPVMRLKIIERDKVCQVCGGCSWDKSLGNQYRIRTAFTLPDDQQAAGHIEGWAQPTHGMVWAEAARRGRVPRRFAAEKDGVWPDGAYCQVVVKWEVDHIIAVKDGGTDDPSNLRLLCVPCHARVTADQRARWASEARQSTLFD